MFYSQFKLKKHKQSEVKLGDGVYDSKLKLMELGETFSN